MSKIIISAVIASFLLFTSQSQLTSSNLNSFRIDDNPSFFSNSRIPVTTSTSSLLNNNVRFQDNPNRLFDDSTLKIPISRSSSSSSSLLSGSTLRFEDNPNRLIDNSISRSSSLLSGSTLRFEDNPNRLIDDSTLKIPITSSSSTLRFEDNPNRFIDDSNLRLSTTSGLRIDDNSNSRLTSANVSQNWSYLVGVRGDCAAKVINNQRPDLKLFLVRQGSAVTRDFRTDRVRIFVNSNNLVVQTPVIG